MMVTVIPVIIGALGTISTGLVKGFEDYTNYSIVEVGQNTAKSPGDLRRLAVNQIPVKDHQPMPVRKTGKE